MRKIIKILVISLLVITTSIAGILLGYSIFFNQKRNIIQFNTIIKEDIRPSYEYLKSVTVLIYGVGEYPPETNDEMRQNRKYGRTLKENNTVEWIGTGVIVKIKNGYTYILTNAHVVGNDMINVSVFVKDEYKKLEAEVIKCHQRLDMSLIKIKGKLGNKQVIKGFSIAKPQDKLYLVGHYLGNPYTYGEGVFAGYNGIYDIIQVPCLWGNSGSGVFNKNEQLVALIFAIPCETVIIFPVFDVSHALAVDGLSIKLFIDKIEELK